MSHHKECMMRRVCAPPHRVLIRRVSERSNNVRFLVVCPSCATPRPAGVQGLCRVCGKPGRRGLTFLFGTKVMFESF